MYRAVLRSSAVAARAARQPALAGGARRVLSTASPASKSTWKGTAVRWGVAFGALYFYNTSPIFADEAIRPTIAAPPEAPAPEIPSIDAVLEEKRKATSQKPEKLAKASEPSATAAPTGALGDAQSPGALEEEAGQQGAFNPETGEINWDCPCLGGMAQGPCGEDFKAAFSCFVFSEQEPKGMDCIDKFQHMQDCFRQHPDVYGAELADDEPEEIDAKAPTPVEGSAAPAIETSSAPAVTQDAAVPSAAPVEKIETTEKADKAAPAPEAAAPAEAVAAATEPAKASATKAKPAKKTSKKTKKAAEAEDVVQAEPTNTVDLDDFVPKAAFDATSANK